MGTRLVALVLILAAAAVAQEKVTIKGKAVDSDGKPVEGAVVSAFWAEGNPTNPVLSHVDGRFELQTDYYGRGTIAILIQDKERKRGAVSRFSAKSFGRERELTLEPLVEVKGKFECKALGGPIPWTNVYVMVQPGGARVAGFGSNKAEFTLLLPPGDYRFHMYGGDVQGRNEERFIEGTEKVIEFGTLDLDPTALALLYGKPAPRIHVTEARGCEKSVQLADFKGRYVLLEFWGFW